MRTMYMVEKLYQGALNYCFVITLGNNCNTVLDHTVFYEILIKICSSNVKDPSAPIAQLTKSPFVVGRWKPLSG